MTAIAVQNELASLSADELKDLMRSVNVATEQLLTTHVALESQVQRLQLELTEANAQLKRTQTLAELGEMAAGIAHEVRNPLGSIELYVQLLREDLADRPEQAELCGKVISAVHLLDSIVGDVLQFARQNRINTAPTAADEVIERSLTATHSLIVNHDVNVVRDRDAQVSMNVDGPLLVQAMVNVIRNAVQATAEPDAESRTIWVSAARKRRRHTDGRRIQMNVLSVRDSGSGVTPDVVKRMFNPFFTTRKAGTGLGLAIVHRIVDAHGGHVSVSNHTEGGALIELCLPSCPPIRNGVALQTAAPRATKETSPPQDAEWSKQ